MTIKEIAQLAGVSISTVSKVVNSKDENINPETRTRVLKIVKEYNYTPYGSAKAISQAKTFLLGILLRDASHACQQIQGILHAAQEKGYGVMIYDSSKDPGQELKHITSLCKNHVDGVIWEPVGQESLGYGRYFQQQDIEICHINCPAAPGSCQIDLVQMGYQAAQVLVSYSHSHIGCLVREGSRRSQAVLEGFKKCLYDSHIPYAPHMEISMEKDDWHSNILSHGLTGLVSSHYRSCLALLGQLERLHYQVPGDLSLVSLKGGGQASAHFPKISSIQIPFEAFGRFACQRLVEQCEKQGPSGQDFQAPFQLGHTLSLDLPSCCHQKKILVVGSINIDITLNVDALPQTGRTVLTNRHSVIPGGKGANQAVGAAKLGSQVALIGKVGNDYDASLVYSSMEDNHVDIQGICRDFYKETGKAYIHVQNDGESTITILAGANQTLSAQDIQANARLFEHAGYCLLQTEVPEPAIEEAARMAKAHGAKTILKPAAISQVGDSLMKNIDIVVPNLKEAEILCPGRESLEERADYFLEKGAKTAIITLGGLGCYAKTKDWSRRFPAASFTPADNTGGADAFIAALAVYLLHGSSLEQAIQIATCAAGFCVSRQGVIPALIDRNSLETYINRTRPELLAPGLA